MKKTLLALSALLALSMVFIGCGGGDDPTKDPDQSDPTPVSGPTVVYTQTTADAISFDSLGITADNAADYEVKVYYTVTDETKLGWGPFAFVTEAWANIEGLDYNVKADGVNVYPAADLIAGNPTNIRINWWGNDYATLTKVEVIKK